MKNVTPARSLLDRIFAVTRRAGEILHGRADARAAAYGWEVVRTRSGVGRVYRDERWRRARPCQACRETGEGPGGGECRRCAGAGRVVHRPGRWAS